MKNNIIGAAVLLTLSGAALGAEYDKAALQARAAAFKNAYISKMCNDPAMCDITVTVDMSDDGTRCVIQVPVPYTLGIPHDFTDVPIHWIMDPASTGAKFLSVKFKGTAWKQEFHSPVPGATLYTWMDKNRLANAPAARPYAYSIKASRNGKTCTYDPTVVNDY